MLKNLPLLDALRDLFYPPHCQLCENPLHGEKFLCSPCEVSLPLLPSPFCPICSHPLPGLHADTCTNCRGRRFHLQCVVASYQTKDPLRDLIHRFKYGRQLHLRELLGTLAMKGFDDARIRNISFDWLVPVPLHALKEREREFNQSAEIAAVLSRLSRIPVKNALQRNRYTQTQTRFDRPTRMRNLQGAFKVRHNLPVPGKTILMVDDIVTTASTLEECARTLMDSGARAVYGITVARG